MEYTIVKQDFPNGWNDATSMDLLTRLLNENGFKIVDSCEVYANEMVLDARPHTDIYTIEKDGKTYMFKMDMERDLRRDNEYVEGIEWFKIGRNSKPVKQIKFEVPPDRDVDHPICAAIEYWVQDVANYVNGKPLTERKFNYAYWEKIRKEEYAKIKAETEARYNDYLQHPEKYFGPPPRLVEPQLYDCQTVAVVPVDKPIGLAYALKGLVKDERVQNLINLNIQKEK